TDATPSLGVYSLAAQALRAGHRVLVVDLAVRPRPLSKVLEAVRAFSPTLVGISAVTVNVHHADRLASMVKTLLPAVPVVLGGPHGTALPEETFRRYPVFDAIALREGEDTILDLAGAVDDGRPFSEVAGLALPSDGGAVWTPERPLIEDLDRLAPPAWDLLPGFPHGYSAPIFNFKRLPAATLVTSRGCPLRCRFCDRSGFGRRIRFHSAPYVLEMIDRLVHRWGVRHLIFYDDMFVANRKRLWAICEGLSRDYRGVSFSCNGRVGFMNREVLSRLKRAGCWQIAYGIESGDQAILDRIGKKQTLEAIERDVRLTREAGIRVKGLFMMGLPGETRESIWRTAHFARRLELDLFQITKFTPLPGSAFFSEVDRYGEFDRDWSRMNMLNFVFVAHGFTGAELEDLFWQVNRHVYRDARMALKLASFFLSHPSHLGIGLRASAEFFGNSLRRRHRVIRRKGF
ncbi:MAG: B12-binding domain-containing radical SAM protein, partial [Planctomycetota bacterium]